MCVGLRVCVSMCVCVCLCAIVCVCVCECVCVCVCACVHMYNCTLYVYVGGATNDSTVLIKLAIKDTTHLIILYCL